MANIDISTAGQTGLHQLARVNVNTDDDYIYFKSGGAATIPAAMTTGTGFIYRASIGAIGGLTTEQLVFVKSSSSSQLQLSATSGGAAIDFTGAFTAGIINFSTPVVYGNRLSVDGSTATTQAVKYYTAGTPLTGLVSGNTYFLRNVSVSDFAGSSALYSLTGNAHTFTSGGVTGRVGPTIAQLRTAYASAGTWINTYLQQGDSQGYQDWTVPVSGIYEFTVSGAAGYKGNGSGTAGSGATVKGRVTLTKGEIITVACGQKGTLGTDGNWPGSGGASWVVRKTGLQPLFVAGGGSANAFNTNGQNGVTTTTGGSSSLSAALTGGTNGNGGSSTGGRSAAGGGFYSVGQNATNAGATTEIGGGAYEFGGLTQITSTGRNGGDGGFGGAGSSDGTITGQSGGAGGYSGGAGGRSTTSVAAGGGGGSYISPTATSVATSNGSYETISTFNGVAITNLASYNTTDGTVAVSLVSSFATGHSVHPTASDADANTNAISITYAGNSYHAITPISLDFQNKVVHTAAGHSFSNGQAVVYKFNGTAPAGVASNTIYYLNTVNNWTYRISSTSQTAGFTTINLTTPSSKVATQDTVSRVVVNTVLDTLTITNHGFLVDQPLQYNIGDGTAIAPLQDQTTYYVQAVIDANNIRLKNALTATTYIDLTSAGTGVNHSFIFLTVNALEDTLYIPNHGLVSGQAVKYTVGVGNTVIPGLTDNAIYYVSKVDNSIIKLATNKALTVIANITGAGVGTQSLVITSLDFTTDTITIPAHGFSQGELVLYDARGQTVVSGLTTATPYYVIFVDGDNIKLATSIGNATAGTAVDLLSTPTGVGTQSLQSLSKTPDGIYTIASVPTSNTFTVQARGKVPSIVKTFNPRGTLDLVLSTFKVNSHGFLTGTKVNYSKGTAATVITGLTDLTDYYVVAINRDYFRLATSSANALAGVYLVTSDFGTGVAHTLTSTQINGNITGGGTVTVASGSVLVNGTGTSFSKILKVGDRFRLFPTNTTNQVTFAAGNVNTTTNQIAVTNTYTTGDSVIYAANGGVSPAPLVDGYYYFVRALSSSAITLHNSVSDATNNLNAVDITTTGTGSLFTLTKTTPVSPIVRKITAVGSDTQLTVDRAYANGYSAVSYSYPTFIYVRPQGYSLHRSFDGGVEMSVGLNTSLGQIIRQTRKYFRYQPGKGIQTSFGINFKPSIDIQQMSKYSATTITCTTRRPHGLISGLYITISEATDSQGVTSTLYNGDFQVTVVDLVTFRITAPRTMPADGNAETVAYGFPHFFVKSWDNGAIRAGMFDSQNGMFFEFDGQQIYAVRRSSTQQLAGTASALQGNEVVFGAGTRFSAQLAVGDMIVMRGQSYRVTSITSDTQLSIRPEYKGSSATEVEFNPTTAISLSTDAFTITSHGFSDLLPVVYNSIDGEQIGGLISGKTYYVSLIDNNTFKLKATATASSVVDLTSVGTTTIHSFTPAKSGIIITKTVDTRVPQSSWSIDPVDGSGVTGYNLDLSRIQMCYLDFSWYGAGKIRFGFKTVTGQVKYVHEFIHNNKMYESYFRSGNLPTRYEVATYANPTYIPFLFHWGTAVVMDGGYDNDKAYLFTATSQTLTVPGTTAKSFAAGAIAPSTDLVTIQSHGFSSGDRVQFEGIATSGNRGSNLQNPAIDGTTNTAYNGQANLTNASSYYVYAPTVNTLGLFSDPSALIGTVAAGVAVSTVAQSTNTVTIVSATHGLSTGQIVRVSGLTQLGTVTSIVGQVTVTNSTTFTMTVATSATISTVSDTGAKIHRLLDITTTGNTQYTFFIYPYGALANTSGPGYQPLISLRLSPSVSSGLTGKLGDRDIVNRMQLRMQEVAVSSTNLADVKLILNGRLNNLNFQGLAAPSLTQVVNHTSQDTISGGTQVYNFRATPTSPGSEGTTTVSVAELFELSNSILGGDSTFPDGPDILTICVSRLTGNATQSSAKLTWTEAQA